MEVIYNSFTRQEVEIPTEQYEDIKNSFMYKTESISFLYKRFHEKYGIDKHLFLGIIDNIKEEMGIPTEQKRPKRKIQTASSPLRA